MAATVSLSRTALSLSPLTIGSGPTYYLDSEGLGRPAVSWRRTSMPDSQDVHGSELLSAVKEQSSLPLVVTVRANSYAALRSAMDALTDALEQFTYTATVTVDGVTQVWTCQPADYTATGGTFDEGMVTGLIDKVSITIPVYPIPGS